MKGKDHTIKIDLTTTLHWNGAGGFFVHWVGLFQRIYNMILLGY